MYVWMNGWTEKFADNPFTNTHKTHIHTNTHIHKHAHTHTHRHTHTHTYTRKNIFFLVMAEYFRSSYSIIEFFLSEALDFDNYSTD